MQYCISFLLLLILSLSFNLSCSPDIAGVVLPSQATLTLVDHTAEPQQAQDNAYTDIYDMVHLSDRWKEVKTISGESGEKTISLNIASEEWCISWYAEGNSPESTLFTLIIYREDILTGPIKIITSSKMIDSDTIYMNEGNNDYRIKVIAANINGWALRVGEELSKSEVKSTSYYINYLDYVFSDPGSQKGSVAWELTGLTSQ